MLIGRCWDTHHWCKRLNMLSSKCCSHLAGSLSLGLPYQASAKKLVRILSTRLPNAQISRMHWCFRAVFRTARQCSPCQDAITPYLVPVLESRARYGAAIVSTPRVQYTSNSKCCRFSSIRTLRNLLLRHLTISEAARPLLVMASPSGSLDEKHVATTNVAAARQTAETTIHAVANNGNVIDDGLQRGLKGRHLQMIAFGGVVG